KVLRQRDNLYSKRELKKPPHSKPCFLIARKAQESQGAKVIHLICSWSFFLYNLSQAHFNTPKSSRIVTVKRITGTTIATSPHTTVFGFCAPRTPKAKI